MDEFGYDNRNRLTVAQATGGTVGTYGYNALGERIEKSSGSVTTQSDYDENHRLLSETDAAGTTSASTRDYIKMNGIPIALVDTQSGSSVVGYVTADQLGSPRAVSDSSGSTEWLWPLAGNAWGELSPVSSGLVLNERFPGQYYDQETGLSQNGFRDYDAGVGRYIQSDPMGLFGGQNSTYGYVDGMPLSYTDPFGLRYVNVYIYIYGMQRGLASDTSW